AIARSAVRVIRIDLDGVPHTAFSAANGHQPMSAKVPGSGLPKQSANGPKVIARTLSSGRQELTPRSSYLSATAPLDRSSVRGILRSQNSACGTHSALHDHLMVGDPFLRV